MRYLSTASPGIQLEGGCQLSRHISKCTSDHLSLDISTATSMTIEDICSVLNQQGMIQHKRDNTPFSPSLRPLPGQSIRSIRGRKSGTTRKHLQRKQTDDDSSRGPFVPPKEYEVVWDPVVVKAYLDKWSEKGYLTLKPEKLKWSPFILQRSTKPATNAPLTVVDHGTEVNILDVTAKKGEDGESRPVVMEETKYEESSVDSPLHILDQSMSPMSTSRLKAQIEKDHKLALKLANITTPSTRRTRLKSRETSTPQTHNHTPAPDTPVTRSRIANGRRSFNGISDTPNERSPSVLSTVSRLRNRARRSRSGSAARSAVTRSRSALKTPSIADVGDEGDADENDDRDTEGDGDSGVDYIDVEADVDEDKKLIVKLAEEETERTPMKRLRSRSGTASNHQASESIRPVHADEDLLVASAPEIKRSDSNRSQTRKRMRIDSSPIMEDSLMLLPEEVKHSSPFTMVVPTVTPEHDVPVNGSGINGRHSDHTPTKADSLPTFKTERITEADLDIAVSLAALKDDGRFPDVPSPIKDQAVAVTLVTSVFPDVDQTSPNQIPNPVSIIEVAESHDFNGNPSDPLGPRMEEEDDEYGDIDAEGELVDDEGIDIEAVL